MGNREAPSSLSLSLPLSRPLFCPPLLQGRLGGDISGRMFFALALSLALQGHRELDEEEDGQEQCGWEHMLAAHDQLFLTLKQSEPFGSLD